MQSNLAGALLSEKQPSGISADMKCRQLSAAVRYLLAPGVQRRQSRPAQHSFRQHLLCQSSELPCRAPSQGVDVLRRRMRRWKTPPTFCLHAAWACRGMIVMMMMLAVATRAAATWQPG